MASPLPFSSTLSARLPRGPLIWLWSALTLLSVACLPQDPATERRDLRLDDWSPQAGSEEISSGEPESGREPTASTPAPCGEEMTAVFQGKKPICVDRSWRDARLTSRSLSWTSRLPAQAPARLELSHVALAETTRWSLEGIRDGRPIPLAQNAIKPSDGWQTQVFDLSELGAPVDALRFSSDAPVAWSETFLLEVEQAATPPRPNLVLIILDTLRADHLSLDGHERQTSPALERWAEQAWVFPHSLSASTCTLPSVSSLLSGLAPAQHGARVGRAMPNSVETVAEVLRREGYRTAAITDGGFVAPAWGMAQGFDRYDATGGEAWREKDVAPIMTRAAEWLRENRFEPFFLLVHTYETHMPYVNPEGFADEFLAPGYRGPFEDRAALEVSGLSKIPEADRQRMRDLYDGEVRRADHYLGELLATIDELGLRDRLGWIVTSDHGEEFFEYGGIEHGFGHVYDPHVRVPLVVKPPGSPVAGGERNCPASGLDIAPTLLAMAEIEAPAEWLGYSLLPCAQDGDMAKDGARERPVFTQGLSAYPKHRGIERFRLDLGGRSVIFDRQSGELQAFELSSRGVMGSRVPRALDSGEQPGIDAASRLAFEHLQAMLAWSAGASHVVRLEIGQGELRIPAESRLDAVGVYDGFFHREGEALEDGGRLFKLRTDGPVYLLTELDPGSDFTALHVLGETRRVLPIATRTREGRPLEWRPLGETLPPPWVIFRGAAPPQAEERQISAEEEAELRSLGYL